MAAYGSGAGQGHAYVGSSRDPQFNDFPTWGTDPQDDYWREAAVIINRSWWLWRNDPYARALVETVTSGTIGALGLQPKSIYQADDDQDTTEAERETRRLINSGLRAAYKDTRFDASGQLSRRAMSAVMMTQMIVSGDAFAVRQWKPNRPGRQYQATCWRIVEASRITNENWGYNTDTQYEGLVLDKDGTPTAIKVQRRNPYSVRKPEFIWDEIPMFAKDGSRNVVHLKAPGRADQLRGMGWFAPVMGLLKHLGGVTDAYVMAKRIQACMGLIVTVGDQNQAAAGDKNGAIYSKNFRVTPGMTKYIRTGDKVEPLNWNFNGGDHSAFADTLLNSICSAWCLPVDFVRCSLGKSTIANARVALLQAYRTFHLAQEMLITHVEQPFAESVILEDMARGRLPGVTMSEDPGEMDRPFALQFSRPPKPFPDPVREATAAKLWTDLGKSVTTTMQEQGMDLENEVMQLHSDMALFEAQGVPLATDSSPTPGNDGGNTESVDGEKVDGAKKKDDGDESEDKPDEAGSDD